MTQTSKIEWLRLALTVLIEHGPEQIKIVPLCERLGVTKGSFYHHFKNRTEFVEALFSYWQETLTTAFIQQANTEATPLERLEKLDQVIAAHDIAAETHIRAWALREPNLVPFIEAVDKQRQAYLSECYQGLGLPPAQAHDIAMMSYANFIGMQHIRPTPSVADMLRISAMGAKAILGID